MREIVITTRAGNSHTVKVDEQDLHLLTNHKWCFSQVGRTHYAKRGCNGRFIYLHREIMKPDSGLSVDHINGDGLDNRRSNLRIVTHAQNMQNRRTQKNNKSGFIGVSMLKSGKKRVKKYIADIRTNGKSIRLGYFLTPHEAAIAYNKKALELFGQFAKLNPI